jgi:hypothetical protein
VAGLNTGRLTPFLDTVVAEVALVSHISVITGAVGNFEGDGVKGADHGAHCTRFAFCGFKQDCAGLGIPAKGPGGTGIKAVCRVAMPAGEGKGLVFDTEHPHIDLGLAVAKGTDEVFARVMQYGAGGFTRLTGKTFFIVYEYSFHRVSPFKSVAHNLDASMETTAAYSLS